jgi:hypothetical protein
VNLKLNETGTFIFTDFIAADVVDLYGTFIVPIKQFIDIPVIGKEIDEDIIIYYEKYKCLQINKTTKGRFIIQETRGLKAFIFPA